jgi:hypothetical protein
MLCFVRDSEDTSRINPRSKIRFKRVQPRISSSRYVVLAASQIGAKLGTDWPDFRHEFVARTRQNEKMTGRKKRG